MIINYFLVFSIFLSILYFLGELNVKNKTSTNYYLFIIFLLISFLQFNSFLWSSELILEYPHFLYINIPSVVLLGPILERYLFKMWDHNQEEFGIFLKKCFFSLFILLFFFPILFKNSEEKRIVIQSIYSGSEIFTDKVTKLCSILILLFYIIKITVRFSGDFRVSTLKKSSTLKIISLILILSFTTTLIAFISLILGNTISSTYNGILIGTFLCVVYIIRQRYPEFFLEVKKIAQEEKKYKISQLKNLDLNVVKSKLEKLFLEDKIYLQEDISLSVLAGKLGLTPHQFSEFLNQEEKINFFQLINKYRIEEAKKLLLDKEKKTILSVAYEVGYQNKSTFNELFKKETGLTPTEWKKKGSLL